MSDKINVLILGSGGREHAIAAACARSPRCGSLFSVPGNPGIARLAQCLPLDLCNGKALIQLCRERAVNLIIVGPEVPLAKGIADVLRSAGILVFGPGKAGAQLEASKIFAKQFMKRHNIPTADFRVCTSVEECDQALKCFRPPYIVKASGLAAGKGVFIEENLEDARTAVRNLLIGKKLGQAGEHLVIEEALPGRELSVMCIIDGKTYRLLNTSQDHKRAFDGDQGPNTGGMGAYSPAPLATPQLMKLIEEHIIIPSINALKEEGIDYRGVLYIGLMISPDGVPKVLEYNVRLGDPETEVLLPLFEGDWIEMCLKTAQGQLEDFRWPETQKKSVCVILASQGYPENKSAPGPITGIQEADNLPGVQVYHAGTSEINGTLMATGGRVLCVSAVASTLQEARDLAYKAVKMIHFPGMRFRIDIAHQAFERH